MLPVLLESGIESTQLVELAYGVDVGPVRTESARPRVAGRLTVGFSGTLAKHKGCHVLVDAVRGMDQAGLEVRIYGRGSDDASYFAVLEAAASGLASIRFMGTFERTEIGRVLGDMDALIVPSLWRENAPLVALAALQVRRPVIGSDVAGIAAAIQDGKNGILIEPGNVTALREAIERLRNDVALYDRLAAGCVPGKSSSEYADSLLAHYATATQAS